MDSTPLPPAGYLGTSNGAAPSTPRLRRARRKGGQLPLPAPSTNGHLTISQLETWLWDAACAIRGAQDAPKFKDFILPLLFYKRLSDVFDDRLAEQVTTFGDADLARDIVEQDHLAALRDGRPPMIGVYLRSAYRWDALRNHPADGTLGQFVTEAMRRVTEVNPALDGVLNVKDFNETQSGQRTLDDDRLASLIEVLSSHRLGLADTEADILGRAYEYLLRKFAEGQGQSAGEFYTPKEVAHLMAELIEVPPYATVYDPTCGSGGLLIQARMGFERQHPDQRTAAPRLYGQELNATTNAMAKMNMFLHGYEDAIIAIGDTFTTPQFATESTGLRTFDRVVANPMWNQKNYSDTFYQNDRWGRFQTYGVPPESSADWGWVQHIAASLKDGGRACVVLDTGAASRGSGGQNQNRERTIREKMVEADLIEGVVLLPENLFYNTTAPGILLVLSRGKPTDRRGQLIVLNASAYFVKRKPKNELTQQGIAATAAVFRAWETQPKLSRIVPVDELRSTDYNLSPSQFVAVDEAAANRPLASIISELRQARLARERADAVLNDFILKLALEVPPP